MIDLSSCQCEPPNYLNGFNDEDLRLLEGCIDLHLHPLPCLYDRPFDEIDLAIMARAVGYKGLVLKSIYSPNADRVQLVRRIVPGIDLYGSIVLNHSVGGVNPSAVEAAIGFGVKAIWLPTVHAANHIKFFGVPTYPWQNKATGISDSTNRIAPLSIIDENGALTDDCKQIIELAKEHGQFIGTGHVSRDEVFAALTFAKSIGFERMICTHCGWHATDWSTDDQKAMANLGAWMEYTVNPLMPNRQQSSPKDFARNMHAVGADRCVVATDLGQMDNSHPIDGMRMWLRILLTQGFSREQVDMMAKTNPARVTGS